MRCAVTIAAAATIAFGQVAGRGVISGTVIEATISEPVREAIVTLTLEVSRSAGRRPARTDPDSSVLSACPQASTTLTQSDVRPMAQA